MLYVNAYPPIVITLENKIYPAPVFVGMIRGGAPHQAMFVKSSKMRKLANHADFFLKTLCY